MPRQPRLDLPNIPQHVVQRGIDRQPCFFTDVDRVRYLQDLREISLREDCIVHAYVLMTNHVHLLMTPAASGKVSRVMQSLVDATCATSTIATGAQAPCGKDATSRPW